MNNKTKIKDATFAFRIASSDLAKIRNKAEKANLSVTDFFTLSALGKNITVMDDLSPMISQLKAVGNNLNQLTMLANMDKIQVANLVETKSALEQIHNELAKISAVI